MYGEGWFREENLISRWENRGQERFSSKALPGKGKLLNGDRTHLKLNLAVKI